MTKQEFNKYVSNFNKTPGNYSESEIQAIGEAHRTLPLKDKNWNYVAGLLGWNGTGESLRCHIKAKLKKKNLLNSCNNTPSEETIEKLDNEDTFKTVKETLLKEKQKIRDERNSYRRALREDSRVESFKEAIRDSVSMLNSLPRYEYSLKERLTNCQNEGILLLSDMHIGVECDNFYNKYNSKIAERRLDKVIEDTINYCHLMNVYQLNVVNLGDLIHGIIHISARIEEEFDIIEQIMTASELLARALNKLQQAVPHLIYRSVVDNHSRANANKDEAIEAENFNRIIDWYVQERLKDTRIEFVYDNLDEGMGKFTLMNGKRVMFAHGHQDNINQAFQHFVGATEQFIHYILLGHYHCEKAKSYQGAKVIVNGSIVGTEQYALSKRLFSKPSQTLLIFEADNLINISIGLDINE